MNSNLGQHGVSLIEDSFDQGHDNDCRYCAMARVLALLNQHSDDLEFLAAVSVVIEQLQAPGRSV